jgi:hypothetical protein
MEQPTRSRPPGWRRRLRPRHALWLALALAAVGATGVGAQLTAHRALPSGAVRVARTADTVAPGVYVEGNQLDASGAAAAKLPSGGGTRPLVAPALAPLVGADGPVAALSPDGHTLAYNTWKWLKDVDWYQPLEKQGIQSGDALGTASIHLLNLATGSDSDLGAGSFSFAWRADGALAYARGADHYQWNTEYDREVLVRSGGVVHRWSTQAALYTVLGWAGQTLLARMQVEDGSSKLLAFDAAGSVRTLTSDELVAVSPDGTTVLVVDPPVDTAAPSLRLLRVADGSEIAALPLAQIVDPVTGAPVEWVAGPADWEGSHAVAATETGLVVLSVSSGAIGIGQVLHLDAATQPNGMLYEPRFTDASQGSVVVWEDVSTPLGGQWRSAQLVCDRSTLSCSESTPVGATLQPRPVYDQSGGS